MESNANPMHPNQKHARLDLRKNKQETKQAHPSAHVSQMTAKRKTTKGLVTALLSAFLSPPAFSEPAVAWKDDVYGWQIYVDPSVENGCFMTTSYETGTILRIGMLPSESSFDFTIMNPNWKSIENNKMYPMSVVFGNRNPWTGEGVGYWWGDGSPSLVLKVPFGDNRKVLTRFIDDLMVTTHVVVRYENKQIANLKLTGSYAAMMEVMACQAAMWDASPKQPTGPFSSNATPENDDPFQ